MSISLLLTALLVFVSPQPLERLLVFVLSRPAIAPSSYLRVRYVFWAVPTESHVFVAIGAFVLPRIFPLLRRTNIDLYRIAEWSSYQIRAIAENDLPPGQECEIDTLLLNRVEGSVSMLSAPGPAATTRGCTGFPKPKTVVYKLEIGLPK